MAKKKYKICKSCGGPVKNYGDKKVVNPDFCPYCVDKKGELKGYKDIINIMISYLESEHKEIPESKRIDTIQKWLKEAPAWKDRFISKDVLIEDVREQNFKDIPSMSEKYNCKSCMWYLSKKPSIKAKKQWFKKVNKKYGSCGKILYYKGVPVGYAQFAPKKEFIKLENLEPGSTNTDAWYISCITILKKYHGKGLGKMLVKVVISDLKRRGIEKVQASGQLKGDASNVSSGYWSIYEGFGFKQIGGKNNFKVGEKILNK